MYKEYTDEIFRRLKEGLPDFWDGMECITYMKDTGSTQWRQMEWPGFYFQCMCERILGKNHFMEIPGPRFGNVEFDGFKTIPWDFKAHSIDLRRGDIGKIPTNGYDETCQAIDEYGTVGFIIMSGISEYDDEEQTFKKWHDELKGNISNYEIERIRRNAPSRRRKVTFIPQDLVFAFVNEDNINSCGKFQKSFRNSNGVPRNAKVELDIIGNNNLIIERYKF